jgi:RHS repeat-associated protein
MMPAAAKHAEEIFSLAAGVAALAPRQGTNADSGKKSHQGIFFEKRTSLLSAMWVKWSGTHQVIECRASEIVLGPTIYLYDGINLLEEIDNGGNVLARYNQGSWIDEVLSELRSSTPSYYEQDGLGSVTSLSNASAALSNTYTFDSFGNLSASTGSIANPFQYTGREFDAETGLRFYRLRYFNPSIGRFISEDPIGFGGGDNFYRYVQNNVTLLIDPFGLSSMIFNRANGTLTLMDKDGNVVAVCTAANNTTRRSNGPWPNGTYPFQSHNNHPPDPNGPYGSYGIDVFDVPGRTGMGVHSGRQNSGGPNHPTLGCVRTTDDCMKTITVWQSHDPMTQISIQ